MIFGLHVRLNGRCKVGKIYRNGKTITPTNYIEKVNNSLIEEIVDRTAAIVDLSETNITKIGSRALAGFYSCHSFHFPKSLTRFEYGACMNNTYLDEITGIQNVTSIGSSAFRDCPRLRISELPDGLTSLGADAFRLCQALSISRIPAGITGIITGVFQGCTGLETLTFEGNISAIGTYSFDGCLKLSKLVFPNNSSVPILHGTNALSGTSSELIIYVPDALYDTWIAATNWATYASKIKKISEMPTK